jgi:uncharacterized protein YecT (DUF1311 family)
MIRQSFVVLGLLAGAFVLSSGGAFSAGFPVETVTISRTGERLEIEVAYPRTGMKAIDDALAAFAKKSVDDFLKLAEEPLPDPMAYGLTIGFAVERNDDAMFAVSFDEEYDTGGAHPNHDASTFTFLRPDGWRVYLPEIFERRALQTISGLAIADLATALAGPDGDADVDTIKDGAGPAWDNFENFALKKDTLNLFFPPYQVASYAAGPQESDLPLAKLKGLFRKDWRAPVASFDCAVAASPVEKAICSDVALARLDRAVAEAYAQKLKYAFEDAEKQPVKDGQRAWIGTRDTQCADAAVACLTGMYGARLAELTKAQE